jgi:hypothetical protein
VTNGGPESCEGRPSGPVRARTVDVVGQPVVVVAYDDAELLDIACVSTTLETANQILSGLDPGRPDSAPTSGTDVGYDLRLLSPGGRPVTARPGLRLEAHGALERHPGPVDTLVVVGGFGHRRAACDEVLVAHVRRLARQARRVASACSTGVAPPRTGRSPTASPATTRPSPSTRIRSSSATGGSRHRPA